MRDNLIDSLLKNRILVLDGAMGTMIQSYRLEEKDFRGKQFIHHPILLKGFNDLLVITQPQIITRIHGEYLEAGADIIETCTFNANSISLDDYGLKSQAKEINYTAANLARKIAVKFSGKDPLKPRFVAGSIGPTNKMLSLSPDVSDPGYRAVTFDQMVNAYAEQISGLMEGGVDILLVETVFDTLTAKAALFAIKQFFKKKNAEIPVMVSCTISDSGGRILSGQTTEAFLNTIKPFNPLSIGFNCGSGPKQMRPFLEELSSNAPFYVSVYPNAGFPNQIGEYDESPFTMAKVLNEFVECGFVNIIGGCCGTTPEHIKKFSEIAKAGKSRSVPERNPITQLSGLEALSIIRESNFINIGERTNVAGSKKFAKLIREQKYEEALSIARHQVENGAQILDVNMDDSMLEGRKEMTLFLNMLASDPEISRVPVMIDSSDFRTIEAGLKCVQGKCIVNSISLKEGETVFIEHAGIVKDYGAAVIVMAFDEQGQATSFARRIEICQRAYIILKKKVGFPPEDIIFDTNILTIATGITEHNNYAVDFINAAKWIKSNLPYAKLSGGISNLSFSFRGNDVIRETMHTVFLFHAIHAGLDMGIVNAGALPLYSEIEPVLLQLVEDVVLNRKVDATARLLEFSEEIIDDKSKLQRKILWREQEVKERIKYSLINGIDEYLSADLEELLPQFNRALDIIEGPLMEGMNEVGDLFGDGKMFLPQVVRSARVMKKAFSYLQPVLNAEKLNSDSSRFSGKVLLATVKGDVHDIGKNIVGVILKCNNFEVVDLGVMVSPEKILQAAKDENVDAIGLSGLITPSLEEMAFLAKEMKRQNFKIPLIIGGATTSKIHTAIKIDSVYGGPVVHIRDASKLAGVTKMLLSPEGRDNFINKIKLEYSDVREDYLRNKSGLIYVSLQRAGENKLHLDWDQVQFCKPEFIGSKYFLDQQISELIPFINWTFFFNSWKITGRIPEIFSDALKGDEAGKLYDDAQKLLDFIVKKKMLRANAAVAFYPANSNGDDIILCMDNFRKEELARLYFLRNQQNMPNGEPNLCLADFIAPEGYEDYIGMFAVTSGLDMEKWVKHFGDQQDDYNSIMLKVLADRLSEAFAEYLHEKVRKQYWGYSGDENLEKEDLFKEKYQGIRPAPGYPACPDHSEKKTLFDIMEVEKNCGISLTENYAMSPAASISGYYFSHPMSHYFQVGKIGKDQVRNYALRKSISLETAEKLLSTSLNY
jgi:5-methyltetrahydrofolate--homocysteine methyltransferase